MPNPSNYNNKTEFMEACIPEVINEGKDKDQAVAQCSSMWENRKKGDEKIRETWRKQKRK